MSKNLRISMLMDFYGELLTEKQKSALLLYYDDDLSLGEIADELSISRQGVRDFIKRGEKQLFDFENKLKLAERFFQIENNIKKLEKVKDSLQKKVGNCDEIKEFSQLILEITKQL